MDFRPSKRMHTILEMTASKFPAELEIIFNLVNLNENVAAISMDPIHMRTADHIPQPHPGHSRKAREALKE